MIRETIFKTFIFKYAYSTFTSSIVTLSGTYLSIPVNVMEDIVELRKCYRLLTSFITESVENSFLYYTTTIILEELPDYMKY